MCFSAEASFLAGTVLVASSVPTLRLALKTDRRFLALAGFPLFFGLQQLAEGYLWISIDQTPATPALTPALFFLFFAYFFWPYWVPLSAALIEDKRSRRRLFWGIALMGAGLGLALYLPVVLDPDRLVIKLVKNSIYYANPQMFPNETSKHIARAIYAVIICLPLLGSSHRQVQVFGGLILLSVTAGFACAAYAFTSIWCFLAAWISAYIYLVIRSVPVKRH